MLHLNSNRLTAVDPATFVENTALTRLYLDANRLTAIDRVMFSELSALQILYLDANQLTAVDPATFSNTALTELHLSSNQLAAVDPSTFSKNTALTVLDLSSNHLTTVAPATFSKNTALTQLYLNSNRLTAIDPTTFSELSALTVLHLNSNRLTAVDPSTLSKNTALTELRLDSNQLTAVDPATFSENTALSTLLDLSSNQLTAIDPFTFSKNTALTQLYLNSNRLTAVANGTFASLSKLEELDLAANLVRVVEDGAFDFAHTNLAASSAKLADGTPSFLYNPNPLHCESIGPGAQWNGSALHCQRCTQGYVTAADVAGPGEPTRAKHVACTLPHFQLDNRTNSSAQNALDALRNGLDARRDELNRSIAYIGEDLDVYGQALAGDRTFEPKRDKFRGYAPEEKGFAAIRFEVKVGDIGIGCGAVVAGDLQNGTGSEVSRIRQLWQQPYSGPDNEHYVPRPLCTGRQRLLRFEVLTAGRFDFSSCGSRFPASLGVYNASCRNGSLTDIDCIVWPPDTGDQDPQYPQETESGSFGLPPLQLPGRYSCSVGASANLSNVSLAPGTYLLGVQPLPNAPTPEPPNDVYEVEMRCRDGDTTAAPLDPTDGGVTVDPVTGQLTVSPGKDATSDDYDLNLTAIDSAGARTTLLHQTLRIERRQKLALQKSHCGGQANRTAAANVRDKNCKNGDAGRHNLGSVVVFPAFLDGTDSESNDGCNAASTFDHFRPDSNGDPQIRYDVAIATADGNQTQTDLGQDTFVNGRTGKLSFTLDPHLGAGKYSVSLYAYTGDATVQLVLQSWVMDVRPKDTANVTNGPNGHGCGDHGESDDVKPQDDAYTCRCNPHFEGQNCETPTAAPQEATTLIGAVLGSVAAVLLFGLAAVRYQLHIAKNRPINVGAMQTELLQRLGLALPTDIGPQEFGITLTLEDADTDDPMLSLDEEAEGTYEGDLDLQPMLSAPLTFNAVFSIGAAAANAPRAAATRDLPALNDPEASEDTLAHSLQFQQDLAAALTKTVAGLAGSMQQLRVSTLNTARGTTEILVVLPRRQQPSDQAVVASLAAAAKKRCLVIGTRVVSAAGLAMPRKIPREIRRKDVMRIELLGEGATAEVHKYELSERQRGTPAFSVAVKSAKSSTASGATRTQLLEEAAMLALLNHRNVLPLVGVVTVPRDLPALVLLQYCEKGTLKDRATAAGIGGVQTVTLLTWCAEVLQALQYISSHRIVHRDIAARNVLLDANEVCKLADFGRSVALNDLRKDYARLAEELPLRHAAVEVLQSGRCSTASDVWSFGCLCWEIFSGGNDPHYDMLSLAEVADHVKHGGILEPPPITVCPKKVFEQLMLPCWQADPAARPLPAALFNVAVTHGAQEDDEAHAERRARFAQTIVPAQRGKWDRNHDAPSVHYVKTVVLADIIRAATPVVAANIAGRVNPEDKHPIYDVNNCTSYQLKDLVVVPQTLEVECPRDRQAGSAYVDMMPRKHVGTATAILSYAWKYPLRLVVGALEEWCTTAGLNPRTQYVWIDVLCWNQHPGRLSDPVKEWQLRTTAIGRQLTMLHPWTNPIYMTRAWVSPRSCPHPLLIYCFALCSSVLPVCPPALCRGSSVSTPCPCHRMISAPINPSRRNRFLLSSPPKVRVRALERNQARERLRAKRHHGPRGQEGFQGRDSTRRLRCRRSRFWPDPGRGGRGLESQRSG